MARYNAKFDKSDDFMYEGRYHVVLDKRTTDDGSVEYKLSLNGRIRWKDAALIDRDAYPYDDLTDNNHVA